MQEVQKRNGSTRKDNEVVSIVDDGRRLDVQSCDHGTIDGSITLEIRFLLYTRVSDW
jgi:hypothetical protein